MQLNVQSCTESPLALVSLLVHKHRALIKHVGRETAATTATGTYAMRRSLPCVLMCTCPLQGTCGAIYGVVPFVSRRSTGLCCGLVSAGGAIGGVMNQGIFFLNTAATGPYCEWQARLHMLFVMLQTGLRFMATCTPAITSHMAYTGTVCSEP